MDIKQIWGVDNAFFIFYCGSVMSITQKGLHLLLINTQEREFTAKCRKLFVALIESLCTQMFLQALSPKSWHYLSDQDAICVYGCLDCYGRSLSCQGEQRRAEGVVCGYHGDLPHDVVDVYRALEGAVGVEVHGEVLTCECHDVYVA